MQLNLKEELEKYITTQERIKEVLQSLSEEEKEFKPEPNRWSIREILNHLCDSEIIAVSRLLRIATEENPQLNTYDQNLWATKFKYQELDDELALLIFGLLRTRIYEILHKLPPEVWIRKGIHPVRGEMTFFDMFKLYVEHGESHLKQINENIKLLKK